MDSPPYAIDYSIFRTIGKEFFHTITYCIAFTRCGNVKGTAPEA
jgi:hypothetical protein